ncbi:MAG: hypothetical protein ACU0BS_11165 [Hasllibacter sp.]
MIRALVLMAAAPAAAQDVTPFVECGARALALQLLQERYVEEGEAAARAPALDARLWRDALGFEAARSISCALNQITYEVGTSVLADIRLDDMRRDVEAGASFRGEVRDIAAELEDCVDGLGGPARFALSRRLAEAAAPPCGWR